MNLPHTLTDLPERAKAGLTHKVGPLPVWAWGAIIVGAVVIIRKGGLKIPASSSTTTTGTTLLPGTPAGGTTASSGGGSVPGATATGSDTTAPATGSGVSAGGITTGGVLGSVAPSGAPIGAFDWSTFIQKAASMFPGSYHGGSENLTPSQVQSVGASLGITPSALAQAGLYGPPPGPGLSTPTGSSVAPSGVFSQYSGVVGVNGNTGNIYKNGTLVGSVPITPQTDLVALGKQYGL